MDDPIFTNNNQNTQTLRLMAISLICAICINIPLYGQIFQTGWSWAYSILPFGWAAAGLSYMATFFHELGHTIWAWFYGYPTLPMFDFQHGGGLALSTSDQQILILLPIWAALSYGIWFFNDIAPLKWALIALGLINIIFAFNDGHMWFINFFGPAAESLIAAFLLFRALFDLAPRGLLERYFNAIIGFGLIIFVYIDGIGLLQNAAHRHAYYHQKGAHGFGDFDKIADQSPLFSFNGIVIFWLILNTLCLILPLIIYHRQQDYTE